MASDNVRSYGIALRGLVLGILIGCVSVTAALAQAERDDLAGEEARQVQVAERFLDVLEKNPRRGTALDRVYGHHVEFGTLDSFLEKLRGRVQNSPEDGAGWMLLGLFEAHRGQDAAAVDAFRKAEQFRPDDALGSYYLGQALLLMGQPAEAVQAFERAIERNPQRTDLLEIFQQLGRVHQRAQRTEEALKVWERLEAMFPDDPRVQEQIAVTLVEEGEYAQALPRYEKLATLVKDDYRKVMFQIQAAELKIRESRKEEGLQNLEGLLSDLNPDSWLHRDVRRRIEEVFLKSGDQDGLVKYYEKWISGHTEDVDGMARLAKFLASSARIQEATTWMEKALKLAPSRTELRKAFIDQLVDDQRYPEAIQQYALLVDSAPGNAEFLRDWGKLVLKNKDQSQEVRQQEATRIWNMILTTRKDDAPTTAQVADLFRQANINEPALSLYQKAVELAPDDPQYREYLGEYYHILKRPDEALQTWRAIAEELRHNAVNVARLAEIYNSFGYLEQAVKEIAEACRLDAKDFSLQIKAAEYHSRASLFDESLQFVSAADQLAANDEERDAAIKQRIEVLQSSRRLDDAIDQLAATVSEKPDAALADLHLLARYHEADRNWTQATEAIDQALSKDGKSIPVLGTAARIAEQSGDFSRAATMNRQLSEVDRRSRSDHLMNVARLESQLGRSEEALQAGRDLITSAPGNTDNYEFYSQLCFQLGKTEDGLDALRKAVRINPTEPHLIMSLGSALAGQFRTDEAIEVYWRAFDKAEELEDKTTLTSKLTELHLQVGQFDKVVERFERDRREDDKRREMTLCLAQAHHSSGDYGTARQELESLLSEETRDTNLLQQLSKLCEDSADIDAAIEYQRQLVAIAAGHETEYRLAQLLETRGDRDEASEILVRLTRREESPERLLKSIDLLLGQSNYASVLAITEPLLSEQRDDWELLYREGVAWASLEKPDEATNRFERLLSIAKPHDLLGVNAEAKFKQAQAVAKSNNIRGIVSQMPKRQPPTSFLGLASQIRQAVGLDANDNYYYSGSRRPVVWTPDAFGAARMAAYAWLLKFHEDKQLASTEEANKQPVAAFVEPLAKRAAEEAADRETIYDWMYVEQLQNRLNSVFQISKRLAANGGMEEQQFYLSSLRLRQIDANALRSGRANTAPKKDPLKEDELELMVACYQALTRSDAPSAEAAYGGQVTYSSDGQMYVNVGGNWIAVGGAFLGGAYLGIVFEELKLAGREEQANGFLNESISKAKTPQELRGVMQLLLTAEKFEELNGVYPRWIAAALDEVAKAPTTAPSRMVRRAGGEGLNQLAYSSSFLSQWMGKLGPQEENERILAILDPALDLAVAEGRKRRAQASSMRKRPTTSSSTYYGSLSLMYGKEYIRYEIQYPRPNEYVDVGALTVLREVFEVFKRNDVLSDLPDRLRKRVDQAQPEDRAYEQLMLGDVLWWLEEQDEAIEVFAAAAETLQNDPSFRLEVASLHEARGDYDEALAIVESVVPRDQELVQQREKMAMQLAERLGDINRARHAAERLFGLRLDNAAQLALVEQMRRLALHDMAEAIVSRVHRRAGNQTASLASLMTLYQGQGKIDLAQQIAHTILRRTTSAVSVMNNSGRNPFRYRTADDGTRTQALRLLQQTGALQAVIERLNSQLERSPNSPQLYEQLIELHQTTGDRDKVQTVLEQAIAQRPDSVGLRYQLAKQLEGTGKTKEACDHYLEILKKRPEWISDELYAVRNVFQRAERSLELVKAFESMNLKSIRQPYYVADMVGELMRDQKNQELALKLFEKVFNEFPSYRSQLVGQVQDARLWKHNKVYELGKKAVIPNSSEASANPWFGVDQIYSYSSGGQVNGILGQLLNGVKGTERMTELRQSVETTVAEIPGWHGGRAMLALMDLKSGKTDEARQRLEALLADEKLIKEMPSQACWIIGQELDQFEGTRKTALLLFEKAVTDQQSMSQIQYSPVTRLVKLYADSGRKADARELMLKMLKTSGEQYDAQYAMYIRVENSNWVGQKMLDLGFPVDAVRLYREISSNTEGLQQAGQWYGGDPNQFVNQVKAGMSKSLAALNEANADDAMQQLLGVPENLKSDTAVLDLMLTTPDVATLRTQHMESPLVNLLQSISKKEEVHNGVNKRLQALRAEHPADVSVCVAQSLFQLRMEDQNAAQALRDLDAVVTGNPLADIPEGRRPNSRERRAALLSVPLWLVARECLSSNEHRDLGEKLAQRALVAAERQVGTQYAAAILYDWGQQALEAGDRKLAEAKWSELLELVTRRPKAGNANKPDEPNRKTPPTRNSAAATRSSGSFQFVSATATEFAQDPSASNPRTRRPATQDAETQQSKPASSDTIPPLTISQFRVTAKIALAAAENGMPELSRRAVRSSLAGGIPVPDPSPTPAAGARQRVMTTQENAASSPIESEVAASLSRVVATWSGDGYPPQEVYELLLPLVFPANRPNDILLYADSSKLLDAKVDSLGTTLVNWSQKAGTLEDLNRRVSERNQNPQMQTPALVLQTLAALAADQVDQAGRHLSELSGLVEQGQLPPMVQLACHAAIPASTREPLKESAFKIMRKAVLQESQRRSDRNSSSESLTLGELARRVNRHLADRPQEVQAFYDSYLVGRQAYYAQHSGDYASTVQAQDWAKIAEDAARCGVPTVALDFMGRLADFNSRRYSRPSVNTAMAVVCRNMATLSPEARYEAWRNWTLPQEKRQSVRLVAEWVEPVTAPRAFLEIAPVSGALHTGDLLSNFTELIAAAREVGKLDELKEQARLAHEKKLPNSESLWPLVLIATEDFTAGEPVINGLLATLAERTKRLENQPQSDVWGDYLVYRACLQSSKFSPLYADQRRTLKATLIDRFQAEKMSHFDLDFASHAASEMGAEIKPGEHRLVHWLPASTREELRDTAPTWWTAHEGQIAHVSSAGTDMLCFAYPLTGNFTFSLDCFHGTFAAGGAGYGGAFVQALQSESGVYVWSATGHDRIRIPDAAIRGRNGFNHADVQVADGKLRYYVNNFLVHEESASPTSPWLLLSADRGSLTAFKNLQISGAPVIPREVSLLNGDRFEGWNTTFFNETQPRKMILAQQSANENDSISREQAREPATYDWNTKEGVLLGESNDTVAADAQSWIYYQRPLQDGEEFRYEFFYVPGNSVAHPTIGRVALLLAPQGVQAHWIARPGWDDAVLGISTDNEITEPGCRRGSESLPLRENDWNSVKLAINKDVAVVSLNDTIIYERPLEPQLDRRFGVFRYKRQTSKVRNAVLTGPWPGTLTPAIGGQLAATNSPGTPADRRLIGQIVGERFVEDDAAAVVARARELSDEGAYELLKQWVLPTDDHAAIRLYYQRKPVASSEQDSSDTAHIACPAIDLVEVAERSGKTSDLAAAIESLNTTDPTALRSKTALQALIAIRAAETATARDLIGQLIKLMDGNLPKTLSRSERAAEYVVALAAMQQPALRYAAVDLAAALRERERNEETKSNNGEWVKEIDALAGRAAAVLGQEIAAAALTNQSLQQWRTVPTGTPDSRGNGDRPSRWQVARGVARHVPGETWGQLFFQSPLRGKFEIVAERSLHGQRDVSIAYGMHAVEPREDYKAKRVRTHMQRTNEVDGEIEIPHPDWVAEFRIVVDGTKATTYVNGVQLHEEMFPGEPDPWLVLQALAPGAESVVRNLRILGNPEIPNEVDLINSAECAGWRADDYGETFTVDGTSESVAWQRAGEEILGQQRKMPGVRESLLAYHRPMLEDGEIEFESFYVPGEFEVHPAVGRSAILVRPDGVRLHKLTDWSRESEGLSFDNESPLEGAAAAVALKENDWNKYRVAVVGDVLTLNVNGVDVASHTLSEPSDARRFGLFRYSDRFKSRVRKIIYRGSWPKQIPAIEDQELAYPAEGALANEMHGAPATVLTLARPLDELQQDGVTVQGPSEMLSTNDAGTRFNFKEAAGKEQWPGLMWTRPMRGDCDVTLDFDELQLAKGNNGWGAAFSLRILFDAPQRWAEIGVYRNDKDEQHLRATMAHEHVNGSASEDSRQISGMFESGRLRMVRIDSLLHCLYAPKGSDSFRLVVSYPVDSTPIKGFLVQCAGSDAQSTVSVVASKLTLRTPDLQESVSRRVGTSRPRHDLRHRRNRLEIGALAR